MINIENSNYENIKLIKDLISNKSQIQKKKINSFIQTRNLAELDFIESSLAKYSRYLKHENISIEYAVDFYLKMVTNMVRSQIYFMKTGKYPINNSSDAFNEVYSNMEQMKPYMIGLAISQFFWDSHFKMFMTFKDTITKNKDSVTSYLEIGPGHGLFLLEAISVLGNNSNFDVVDISPISMNITKSIVSYFTDSKCKPNYVVSDMLNLNSQEKYDFITMGEVLEHVNQPDLLLQKLHNLLTKSGIAYVSTCVNCPTIDHVYHFKYVDEITQMLIRNNFEIIDEKIFPTEDLPMQEIIDKKITINYCAIIKRVKNG
ncbi:MAG: methyltransferase domain-containing protein [bacterium]